MAVQIQFRRGTASEWESVNPILAEGEMAIETDTKLFKIGDGVLHWNDLDYGGIRGYVGSSGYSGSIGNLAVDNVLYVSKSGNDANSGVSLNYSKATIAAAVSIATTGTTIFVKSGDYTEQNPINVPPHVSIVGDNLRTVTIRPAHPTQDLFYVGNGCYLAHMAFKDHMSPAAAVAFNPDGRAGVITMSPYVQNCTSMTGDGTGMRVDGNHALGTKSMVVDAYTQYNQGGIGIHLLNKGYAQLVSVFTICCDVGFKAESGGFCSITNSNSSFGNYALLADGVSDPLSSGFVTTATTQKITLSNLTTRPGVGEAIEFSGQAGTFYTVNTASDLRIGGVEIVNPTISNEDASLRNARQAILNRKANIQYSVINYINETYPDFEYNQFKCNRDIGTILNCVTYDMVLGTNYQSVVAGISYTRAVSAIVTATQLTETVAAINYAKQAALALLTPSTVPYIRINNNFNTIVNIIQNGTSAIPSINYPLPSVYTNTQSYGIDQIQNNKDFIKEETAAWIFVTYPGFSYNEAVCKRDVGYILDAICYDLLYGGNSQTSVAAEAYYSNGILSIGSELTQTIAAYNFLKSLVGDILLETPVTPRSASSQNFAGTPASSAEVTTVGTLIDLINTVLQNGYTSVVTLEETLRIPPSNGDIATLYQFSRIYSSSHTFEYIGAGINIDSALPEQGGVPNTDNQAVELNGGRVYFTGTDQKGDFRIGNELVIRKLNGTISGRTFTKSLFAVMTPYILAIGQ
jgi:hypothetical protein